MSTRRRRSCFFPATTFSSPSAGANGDRPCGRAVDEHAVLERHPAEPDLLVAHPKEYRQSRASRRTSRNDTPRSSQRGGGRATLRGHAEGQNPGRPAPASEPEEVDAELEIVDRDPLVGRMDQPSGEVGAHRPQREEPIRDRAERLAQPVRVGEAGDADRRRLRARARARVRSPRSRPTTACRARSACRPARRATRCRTRPPRATRGGSPRPRPRSGRAGAGSRRSRRTVQGSRCASARPRSPSGRPSVRAAAPPSPPPEDRPPAPATSASGGDGTSPATAARKPSVSGISRGSGSNVPEALDQPCRLDERVVGDSGHRGVPAPTPHVQDERRAALLGGRAEIEDAAADLDPVARALVHRVLAPHGLGVLVGKARRGRSRRPRRAPRRRSRRRSGRLRARSPRGQARRSRPRSQPPGPSCPALRDPRRAPRGALPTRGRPTIRRGRRAPCPCARAAEPRAVSTAADPGDEVRALRHPGVQLALDAEGLAGSRGGAPPPVVSFPGGLTVSSRIRSCRSPTASSRKLTGAFPRAPPRRSALVLLREAGQLGPDLPELRDRACAGSASRAARQAFPASRPRRRR